MLLLPALTRIHIHHPPHRAKLRSGLKFFQDFPQSFLEGHLRVSRPVQLDHTLKLILILDPGDDALFWTEHYLLCLDRCHLPVEGVGGFFGDIEHRVSGHDLDQLYIGWVVELLPVKHFLAEEFKIIALDYFFKKFVVRPPALDDHLTLDRSTARTTGHLSDLLIGSLSGAEVREIQDPISVPDSDHGHFAEVESLRDHLGSHQDIDLPRRKLNQ